MALEPLISAAELRTALGRATYMALYDEDAQGNPTGDVATVDGSDGVKLTLARAHVMVVSRLPVIYPAKIPDGTDAQISMLLKHAELLYAEGLSFDRHPEYTNRFGMDPVRDGKYKSANQTMDMIQETILSIVPNDAPPEDYPKDIGGVVVSGPARDPW